MENSDNSGKVILSMLIGIALGGILGILFAPDKGKETRKKIVGASDDLTESLKEKFDQFMGEAKKEVERAKENVMDTVNPNKA